MAERLNVVTGATGLVGSHVVERIRARGEKVRAVVRPTSDVSFLRQWGVELVNANLSEPANIRRAVDGADVVYHCAARVSDWGDWDLFRRDTIEATRNVLEACKSASVRRILHVSSVSVYGNPRPRAEGFTEDEPLGQNLRRNDHYARSKIEAEEIARSFGDAVTIIRPSWTYGPRDRNTIPRVVDAIRTGRARIVGRGDNLLNIVYAADVAEGAILAANHPEAGGQAFNLSSEGEVTQRQLVDALTTALDVPPVTWRIPLSLAIAAATVSEFFARLMQSPKPPTLTRRAIYLIGRATSYSSARARTQLNWRPHFPVEEGMRRSLLWLREQEALASLGRKGLLARS